MFVLGIGTLMVIFPQSTHLYAHYLAISHATVPCPSCLCCREPLLLRRYAWSRGISLIRTLDLALFTGLLHLQFLIAYIIHKGREKALLLDPWHDRHSRHTSSQQPTWARCCTRTILHSVLTTRTGQVPAESKWRDQK